MNQTPPTVTVPALPRGCNSWIVTSPDGTKFHEFYEPRNVELAIAAGWSALSAHDHLVKINQALRGQSPVAGEGAEALKQIDRLTNDALDVISSCPTLGAAGDAVDADIMAAYYHLCRARIRARIALGHEVYSAINVDDYPLTTGAAP